MAFRARDASKRTALWRRKAEEMQQPLGAPPGLPPGRPLDRAIPGAQPAAAARPSVIGPSSVTEYFQTMSMRAAEAQRDINLDWLPGERGPTSITDVAAQGVDKTFLVAVPIDPSTSVEALVTCLGSLLRARVEGEPFGEMRITVYHPASMNLAPMDDVWGLPWDQAGIVLRFRPVEEAEGHTDALISGALFKLRAMNAAVGASQTMQCNLLWVEHAVLFGADPFADVYAYARDMAFMGSHRGGRAYTTSAMLVPFSSAMRAKDVITSLRTGVRREGATGRNATTHLAAQGITTPVDLLDALLTRLLAGRSIHFRVFARTRFIPMASAAQVVAARAPFALTLVTRSTAEEFLAAVDAVRSAPV